MRAAENSLQVFENAPKQIIKIVQVDTKTASWEYIQMGSGLIEADLLLFTESGSRSC